MLTKTTHSAIRALIHLALLNTEEPVSPRRIAEQLGASPTYMAKVMRLLVRANILHAHRGALGGVTLSRHPSLISLQSIVEACQGPILGDFCQETDRQELVCAFHRAVLELHQSIIGAMSRWTLADLASKPEPSADLPLTADCRMAGIVPQFKKIGKNRRG